MDCIVHCYLCQTKKAGTKKSHLVPKFITKILFDAVERHAVLLSRTSPLRKVQDTFKIANFLCDDRLKVITTADLINQKDGAYVRVAGLVLVRQRPGTAGGVCFITIEDETSVANLVVFESLFTTYRKEILKSRLLMVEGKVQKEGEVIHVIVKKCHDLSFFLRGMVQFNDEPLVPLLSRADENDGSLFQGENKKVQVRRAVQQEIFPTGRNFR